MIGQTSMTGPVDGMAGLGYVLVPRSGLGAFAADYYNDLSPGRKAKLHYDFQFNYAPNTTHSDYLLQPALFQQYLGTARTMQILADTGFEPGVTPDQSPWTKEPGYAEAQAAKAAQGRAEQKAYEDKVALQSGTSGAVSTYVDPYTLPAKDYKAWYESEVAQITAAHTPAAQPTTTQPTAVQTSVSHNDCPSGQVLDPQIGLCTWRNWDVASMSTQAEDILSSIPGPSTSVGGFNVPWLLVAGVAAIGLFAFSGKKGR